MDKKHYLTKEGLEKLKKELDFLINKKRKEVIERIQIAKSYGDLSENAEYESAREEQSFVEGRIKELQDILKNVEIVTNHKKDRVSIGSKVILEYNNQELEFQIVGAQEADPSKKMISDESPIGKAILNRKVGEEVQVSIPDGIVTYKIKKII